MKTNSIILAFAIGFFASDAISQSTFRLENYNSFSGIDAPVLDAEGNRLAGVGYAVELWGGAASNSLSPTLDFNTGQRVFLAFGTGLSAGYFTSINPMTVYEVPSGQLAWLQVRAWNTSFGSTYEQVSALGIGGYGESLLLHISGGNPNGAPPTSPNPLIGLESFSLRPVPEPAVWQLSLVGLGALLWFRRKGAG